MTKDQAEQFMDSLKGYVNTLVDLEIKRNENSKLPLEERRADFSKEREKIINYRKAIIDNLTN